MFMHRPLITGLLIARRLPCDQAHDHDKDNHDGKCIGAAMAWLTMLTDGDPPCCSTSRYGEQPEADGLLESFSRMVMMADGQEIFDFIATIDNGAYFAVPFQIRQRRPGVFLVQGAKAPILLTRVPSVCCACRRVNDPNERGEFLSLAEANQSGITS